MSVTSIVRSPTLPTHNVDLTWALPTGGTTRWCGSDPGDDYDTTQLQTAIDVTQPGDVLILRAGDTFQSATTITLPAYANAGADWIYIISSNYANLGTIDRRCTAADSIAGDLPKIEFTATTSRIDTEWNAGGTVCNRIRIMGLEITNTNHSTASIGYSLVALGRYGANNPTDADDQPHHLIIDRCYIHGQTDGSTADGIYISTKEVAVISSTITEIHHTGPEQHGVVVVNGTGDLQIDNCHIEAGDICVLVGTGPTAQKVDQAQYDNVSITRCNLTKQESWKGGSWSIKNCLEFKFGRYILVEGCTIHKSWYDSQDGPVVSIKTANGSTDPWTRTQHLTMRYCHIHDGLIGIKFKTKDNSNEAYNGVEDVLIHDIVMDNINPEYGGSSSTACRLIELDPSDYGTLTAQRITIRHNTLLHDGQNQNDRTGSYMIYLSGNNKEIDFFVFENNVAEFWGEGEVLANRYGIKADGASIGVPSITKACNDKYRFTNNIYVHTRSGSWPPGDTFVADLTSMNFSDYSVTTTDVRGYALTASSPGYQGSTSGRDCGANVGAIYDATLHCEDGDWS